MIEGILSLAGSRVKRFIFGLALSTLLGVVGCTSSTSPENTNEEATALHCAEPQNPYDEGSGHYAGYEWAETNNSGDCGDRSQSFVEGCEEYQRQESDYQHCEAQNRK
jgi:hypothetical protein